MHAKTSTSLLLIGVFFALSVPAGSSLAESAVRFLALGDAPYSASEQAQLDELLARELPRGTPFLVHTGDIKAGSSPCTDEALAGVAERFRRLPVPVVYTPGDNEWTDCRRPAAGGYDPMERLTLLRRIYYGDPGVLRLAMLDVVVPDTELPENYHFLFRDVLVATVHVVGSRNNLEGREPAAIVEYEARSAANSRHLQSVAETAATANALALVLVFHANADLEKDDPPTAYQLFHEDLHGLLRSYPGPVLAIHGDTHEFRFDRPLRDQGSDMPHPRFMRLEVPGSPDVAGVWVTVHPDSEPPFQAEPVYPDARAVLMGD